MDVSRKKTEEYLINPKKIPIEAYPKSSLLKSKILKQVSDNVKNIAQHKFCPRLEKADIKKCSDKASNLINIVNVLPKADKETRIRWSNELILKLQLLQTKSFEDDYTITLDCLYVDSNNCLVVDIIGSHSVSEKVLLYKPPEAFFVKNSSKNQTDVWSAGICIYYINTLAFPWNKASLSDAKFKKFVTRKKFFHDLEKDIAKTLLLMLNVEPTERKLMENVMRKIQQSSPNFEIIG